MRAWLTKIAWQEERGIHDRVSYLGLHAPPGQSSSIYSSQFTLFSRLYKEQIDISLCCDSAVVSNTSGYALVKPPRRNELTPHHMASKHLIHDDDIQDAHEHNRARLGWDREDFINEYVTGGMLAVKMLTRDKLDTSTANTVLGPIRKRTSRFTDRNA